MKSKRKVFKTLDIMVGFATLSSALVLLNAASTYAESSSVDNVTVTVPVSCSMTGTVGSEHTATVEIGTYEDEIGETTFKVLCNDSNGFAVYAIGYSDDTYGNTAMKPSTLPETNAIATGTATSGSTSNWAMKLSAVSGDYAPTLATGFDDYHAVPAEYTKVASFASSTDATVGSSFKSTYAAFVSQAQPADTYVGKVKYTVVHPANTIEPSQCPDIQNLGSASCTTTPSQVRDIRDGHVYTIQRLLDGNCWMMENLDLGRTELTTDLTSANTNLATTVTASTFNSWKKTSGTLTHNAGEFISVDGTDSTAGTPYGTLYNYFVASAGTISGIDDANDATYDICPAGWRLPTGGDSGGEFETLYATYNSIDLMRAPISNDGAAFAFAGDFGDGVPSGQGNRGGNWSSSSIDSERMYFMSLRSSGVNPKSNDYAGYGHAIRCVLKDPIMQDISSWGSSVQEGEEVIAKDKRDGKLYTVARLADGNLWMTQNLDHDIDSTKTYTPADTDIPTNWTPSTSTYSADDTTWNEVSTPESYDPGDKYWDGVTTQNNPGGFVDRISTTGDSHYHLGNYYNWAAAIATNDSSSYTTDGTLIEQSICPAGWTLPRAGDDEDSFYTLISEYDTWVSGSNTLQNNTELWTSPTYFPLSGVYVAGNLSNVGYSGSFWSSVVSDVNCGYGLDIDDYGSEVGHSTSLDGVYGNAIRCIARPVTSTVHIYTNGSETET